MLTCPNCRVSLVKRTGDLGMYWSCERCGGRAVGIGLLRRIIDERVVTAAWGAAMRTVQSEGRPCPVCAGRMKEVPVEASGKSVLLDVCQRCEFTWFDAKEFEAMPPPRPNPHLLDDADEPRFTPEQRQDLAIQMVEQMRRNAEDEPSSDWKSIPAVLGFPVEMDEASYRRRPWATWVLAALIVAVSVAAFTHLRSAVDSYGLIPAQAWRLHGLTFITAFFLHAGIWHLVGNVYFLLIFGSHVEDYLGRWRWLLLIVTATVIGDVCDIMIDPHQNIPTIGASGGISGLIAFYGLKFPHAHLGFLFRYSYYYVRWIRFPAWVALLLWVLLQVLGVWEQIEGIGHVASLAHLGGAAVGVMFWAVWRDLDQKPLRGPLPVQVQ